MKKSLELMLAVLIFAAPSLAQGSQANAGASPHSVKQGEVVTIHVKVKPAPDVAGHLDVFVAPDGSSTPTANGGDGLGPGGDTRDINIAIPIDGKLGNWKVVGVRFQPTNSSPQDLTVSGNITFEVVKRQAVVPTTADVQVK